MTTVAVFPGQGAQSVGMGKALADGCAALTTGPDAAEVADACLRRLVREGHVRPEDLPPAAQAAVAG